ncbi:GPW/gp25 family protein [Pseudomonas sp. NyZ704]|nr:GPW/gp25 family protein [Pseudomonas sp. NyZ704]
MTGMNRNTGKALEGVAHLRQSIADILTTPIGSRIMRRDYGSLLPSLIDQPQNAATNVRLYAATYIALMRWEPRLRLSRISIQQTGPGKSIIDLEGAYVDTTAPVSLRLPLEMGGAG